MLSTTRSTSSRFYSCPGGYLRYLAIPLSLCAAGWLASIGLGQSPDQPRPADSTAIQNWVRGLSDDEYATRDASMRSLIEAGPAAVPPVEQALAGAGLEVTARVIYILQELAARGSSEVEDDVRRVLLKLVSEQTTVGARRAAETIAKLNILRQDKALDELAELGARVDRNYVEPGVMPTSTSTFLLEIGGDWKGSVEDLQQLKWLRDVEQVTFDGEQVTDEWIPYLRGMSRLLIVKFARANITDSGLAALRDVPARVVLLHYVPVGDVAAKHLVNFRQVQRVHAYGTQMSEAGKEELEKRDVFVDLRRGAFLGVSVSPAQRGGDWSIARVTAGSAADDAGILPGDVIEKYDGQAVGSFDDLTALIKENQVGDTVELHIRRGGEILVKKATFGQWQ